MVNFVGEILEVDEVAGPRVAASSSKPVSIEAGRGRAVRTDDVELVES